MLTGHSFSTASQSSFPFGKAVENDRVLVGVEASIEVVAW